MENKKYGITVILYKGSGEGRSYALFKRKEGWVGYEFVKGGIEVGESDYQAAVRELKEEAGLDVQHIKRSAHGYVFISEKKGQKYQNILAVFYCKLGDTEKISINNKEHSEFGFFSEQEVLELLPFAETKILFKKVVKEIDEDEDI